MRPNRPEFDERPASRRIFFVNAGPRPKMQIIDGDIVALKLGDVSVIVHQVASIGASRYSGTIVGFEKWLGPTCEGYAVGDNVEFSERQVFGCTMT